MGVERQGGVQRGGKESDGASREELNKECKSLHGGQEWERSCGFLNQMMGLIL